MYLLNLKYTFVSIIFTIFFSKTNGDGPVVQLSYGYIEGLKFQSTSRNNEYYAFLGVQYAKPPIGSLRFKDPEPPTSWLPQIKPAREFSQMCSQEHPFKPGMIIGNEDCLYLNVYTPTVDPNKKLPVMVWIHLGGFSIEGGSTFDPVYFMDGSVIVVTCNFRLNVLGFMHLDDEHITGNYGMKDQVAVLKWVQNEIHNFGGDKYSVTLAGSSSGAACVNWHMYSKGSEKLFHRAIMQSGTAKSIVAEIPRNVAKERAKAIAVASGATFESTKEIAEYLRKMPVHDLILKSTMGFNLWRRNPYIYGVVVESETVPNAFITKSPWNSLPVTRNIPLIIGFTSDEGAFLIYELLQNKGEPIGEVVRDYKRLFPILMLYQFNVGLETNAAIDAATEKIKNFYFDDQGIEFDARNFPQMKQMLGDSMITYDTIATIKTLQSSYGIFFYQYSHKNAKTFALLQKDAEDINGAVHDDDLLSLFKIQKYFPNFELEGKDLEVSEHMVKLWTNFIKTGNPNYDSDKAQWEKVNESLAFYDINDKPGMKEWDWEQRYNFWKQLKWHGEGE